MIGLGSKWLEQSPIPATLLALLVGIVLGPAVLGVLDPAVTGDEAFLMESAARLTLGIGLVGLALRIPKEYTRRNWREMLVLVGLGMILMWLISSLLVYVIMGFPLWMAALVGAIVTATDPVAAGPIVSGDVGRRNLPERIRYAISFESGANDGLSYLFVFLPLLMLTHSTRAGLNLWLSRTLLWEIGGATIFGVLLGYGAAKLLRAAERRNLIQEEWRLAYTVALALLTVGAGRLIHSDEVLVVFAAGVAFVQLTDTRERRDQERSHEAVNRFFAVPIFVLLGAAIPWAGWATLGWSAVLLAVALLLLRRPLALLLLNRQLPSLRSKTDVLYVSWFGPIAVAAIYYSALVQHRLGYDVVWDVVTLIICASVVAHGLTAAPLTRLYGARQSSPGTVHGNLPGPQASNRNV